MKRIDEVSRDADDSSTASVMQHVPRVCFLADIVSSRQAARNRRTGEAAGLCWTIAHEIGIKHAEPFALWLMDLTDGEERPGAGGLRQEAG